MVVAGAAEGVKVVLPDALPAFEVDAELEGGVGRRHELRLVDAQQVVKGQQGRDGRLTDPDGADFFGLHQLDVQLLAQQLAHQGGHHPAGGSTPSDHDTIEGLHGGAHRLS